MFDSTVPDVNPSLVFARTVGLVALQSKGTYSAWTPAVSQSRLFTRTDTIVLEHQRTVLCRLWQLIQIEAICRVVWSLKENRFVYNITMRCHLHMTCIRYCVESIKNRFWTAEMMIILQLSWLLWLQAMMVTEMFAKHLLQLHGMTADKALAITQTYPTPTR